MRRAFLLALGSVVLLAGLSHAQTVQITSNITSHTVWGPTGTVVGDIFWVRNSISVSPNVILEIEPGVIVKFDPFSELTVNGRLRASGSLGSEIVFTSIKDDNAGPDDTNGDGNLSSPNASDWEGITFPNASADSSLISYSDIRYAGYNQRGALFFENVSDSVVNSTIRSSYYGVECRGTASPVISATSIEASTQTPVTLDFTATPSLDALVFSSSDNGYDAFGLRGGTLSGSATLPVRGATVGVTPISNVTYVLLSSLTIAVGGSLTVDPAVVIKPLGGGISVLGSLTLNGTSGNEITVTSIRDDNFGNPSDTNNDGSLTAPGPGNWGPIDFADGSSGSIQYCRLKFGSGVSMTNENIGISNTLLSDAQHGVALYGTSTPTLNTVTIQNSASTPVLMSAAADPTFTNVTFIASGITALGILPEVLSVNARLYPRTVAGYSNITYVLLDGFLTMNSPSRLTVDPGVVLKFKHNGSGAGLVIDGALVADGKPESLIVFTSYRDDLYGNPADTNGDGSISAPGTGDWTHIAFGATSDDATCRLDRCRITYASGAFSSGATLRITNAAPTVTNCTIANAATGVRMEGNAAPTIDNCSITNCGNAPFLMSVLSDPTLTNNNFATNGYNAIGLISETLSQDATLEYRAGVGSPPFAYMPVGPITIGSGVTLSIQPQVVIKPQFGGTVLNVDGALNAIGGTGSQRIVFTSIADDAQAGDTNADGSASSPNTGQAGILQFNNTSVDAACILRNVLYQFGGNGVITTVSASPRIARSEFFQNNSVLYATGMSQPSLDSLTVLNCTYLPFQMSLVSDPQIGSTLTLANNAYTAMGIIGETHAQDVRLRVRSLAGIPNITYALAGDIGVAFGAKLTIDPGIHLKMGPGGSSIGIDGALVADGKPESLIVFTSIKDDAIGGDTNNDGALTTPAAGNWSWISFSSVSDDANTVIDHCRFRYGGADHVAASGTLRFTNAGPSLTNSVITSSTRYAVHIEGNSSPSFSSCNFDSSGSAPVSMSLVSEPTFTNVQFLGNAYTALSVIPETIAQDLLWRIRSVAGKQNMPYLVEGALISGLGSTLTLQPGLIVKFDVGGSLAIKRAFVAEGRTPRDSMIAFTALADDFHGGDTDNNGNAIEPMPGSWQGVTVEGTAIDPDVRFRNCVFRYGGQGFNGGALKTVNSGPSVDSCLFAYNTIGISATGTSNPTIHGSSFVGNSQFAIRNHTASFCIDAENNWWGASSGPADASSASDLCGLGSNAGSGNAVSDNVDYDPWITGGSAVPILGDVSLNGEVRAFDASLVLQYVVSLISLSDLQKLVADVSGSSGITAFDASLILQYVAGTIRAFPAASTLVHRPDDILAARELVRRANGDFTVELGARVREGNDWLVPVIVTGSAPIWSLEVRLSGSTASALSGVTLTGGSGMVERLAETGGARVAAALPVFSAGGEVMRLRIPVGEGEWSEPQIVWGRVNETEIAPNLDSRPTIPSIAFLRAPAPNPARDAVTLTIGLSNREAGPVSVEVLDLSGRRVRQVSRREMPAGVHVLRWDLRDAHGAPVPAGVYLIRAEASGVRFTRRLAVVR